MAPSAQPPPASPNWPEGRSTPPAETCPKQEESGRTRDPQYPPKRSPLPLRFLGEGSFLQTRLEDPKQPRGKEQYSRHLVDVKRETLHMVFYSSGTITKRVTGRFWSFSAAAAFVQSEWRDSSSPSVHASLAEASLRTVALLCAGFNARSRCSYVDGCGLCGKSGGNCVLYFAGKLMVRREGCFRVIRRRSGSRRRHR